jgi:hypothetical protein
MNVRDRPRMAVAGQRDNFSRFYSIIRLGLIIRNHGPTCRHCKPVKLGILGACVQQRRSRARYSCGSDAGVSVMGIMIEDL